MDLLTALSPARLQRYIIWAHNDHSLALTLYAQNVHMSADFYIALHMLEVTLRNKTNAALTRPFGDQWLIKPPLSLTDYQKKCIADAQNTLCREHKNMSHDALIAELNFGFWCSFYTRESYLLWQYLRPLFQQQSLKQKHIAQKLYVLRRLRNRVAHYEPILHLPLNTYMQDLLTLLQWLAPETATWVVSHTTWHTQYQSHTPLI